MKERRPTISDVARLAKTSVGTVSHVFSGRAQVSDDLRERVLKAVQALGFEPSFHAQGIKGRRSRVIGSCFPHSSTNYLNTLSETVEALAGRDDYRMMHVFSRQDPEAEISRVKELIRYRVDGLVLFPTLTPTASLDTLAQSGLPTVVLDRETDVARFDHVIFNHRKSTAEAAARLIALGHRRILFVSRSEKTTVTQHRLAGIEDAARAAQTAVVIDYMEFGSEPTATPALLGRLGEGATALILSSSRQAVMAMLILRRNGIECPRDLSVLAFDDPDWASLVEPRLSVIRQPAALIAEAAWKLLASRIANPDLPPRRIAFDAEIDFRESIAPPERRIAVA